MNFVNGIIGMFSPAVRRPGSSAKKRKGKTDHAARVAGRAEGQNGLPFVFLAPVKVAAVSPLGKKNALNAGDKVSVLFEPSLSTPLPKGWRLCCTRPGEAYVHFDGQDNRLDTWVPSDLVERIDEDGAWN